MKKLSGFQIDNWGGWEILQTRLGAVVIYQVDKSLVCPQSDQFLRLEIHLGRDGGGRIEQANGFFGSVFGLSFYYWKEMCLVQFIRGNVEPCFIDIG